MSGEKDILDSRWDLSGLEFDSVLSQDPLTKTIALLCRERGTNDRAVVVLSRRAFSESDAAAILSDKSKLELQFQNDIYSKYAGILPTELAQVNIDITSPATDKHISKHQAQSYSMIHETPEDYRSVVLPFIEAIPANRTQWVDNILAGKAEAERVLHNDQSESTGFVLLPDMKWDQTDNDSLYCVAISHRKDIRSLRDLRSEHLPLLRNIMRQSCQVLENKFAIKSDHLRIYVHYQPSYYHFHVHFSSMKQLGSGLLAGKAHVLSDVIDNIATIAPDYYAKRTLAFALGERDPLFEAFCKRKAATMVGHDPDS
ncbi:hypothetical protein WJX73_002981 [Symbiochloris irregularis]|uniref:m7GpppX diphosphatase n=1 Tax=Symbiochloris irregularis TaxID=706552 RepID=A0AAW1NS68_9CHLO